MRRILLISSSSSPMGGGERYLAYLAKGLTCLGHSVSCIVNTDPYMDVWAKALLQSGATVIRIPYTHVLSKRFRFLSAWADKKTQHRLARVFAECAPDVMHINQQYDEDALDLLLAAFKTSIPFISTVHVPLAPRKGLTLRTSLLRIWYKHNKYPKIFVSEAARKAFNRVYPSNGNASVVLNGIERPARVGEGTRNRQLPPEIVNGRLISFFGRIVRQKRPLVLLEAFQKISRKHPDARLAIVGDGNLRALLRRKIEELRLEKLVWTPGWLYDCDHVWAQTEVVALSSEFEGCPLALLEGLCLGKKAVAAPFEGASELKVKTPWLVVAEDLSADGIASALEKALSSPDPTEPAIQGARNFFSVERMAADTLDVYEQAIGGRLFAERQLALRRSV